LQRRPVSSHTRPSSVKGCLRAVQAIVGTFEQAAAPVDDLLLTLQEIGRCLLKSTGSVVERDGAGGQALLLLIELGRTEVVGSLPLVGDAIPVIRDSVSVIGQAVPLVRDLLSSIESKGDFAKVTDGCLPLFQLEFSLI
jgi:hypothetical protein